MSKLDTFESSYGGDNSRIGDTAKLECGICWTVYDPEKGDEVWQIAPGTPFSQLPNHWRCPHCDAPQHKFMVIGGAGSKRPEQAPTPIDEQARLGALEAAFQRADGRMKGLPVYNDRLAVASVGFRRLEADLVGVVTTPWAMNIICLPASSQDPGRPEGSKRLRRFPSGEYEFVAGHLDGVGFVEMCSLFSPMDEFTSQDEVLAVAVEAARALHEADEPGAELPSGSRLTPVPEPDETAMPAVEIRPSRRDLFVPRMIS
jgi:[NiFe] hydrogenase assembly HybE family chaperone